MTSNDATLTGAHKELEQQPNVAIKNHAQIILTQAFGPKGDNLVGISDVTFDGYPALTLLVRGGAQEGLVHLSPIHGDDRKIFPLELPAGTRCELLCPVSKEPLPIVATTEDEEAADYCAIFLTRELSERSMALISNVVGHYHSRVIDHFELLSYWAGREEG